MSRNGKSVMSRVESSDELSASPLTATPFSFRRGSSPMFSTGGRVARRLSPSTMPWVSVVRWGRHQLLGGAVPGYRLLQLGRDGRVGQGHFADVSRPHLLLDHRVRNGDALGVSLRIEDCVELIGHQTEEEHRDRPGRNARTPLVAVPGPPDPRRPRPGRRDVCSRAWTWCLYPAPSLCRYPGPRSSVLLPIRVRRSQAFHFSSQGCDF